MTQADIWEDVRCKQCNKLLFKHMKKHTNLTGMNEELKRQIKSLNVPGDEIEVKCDRCKHINHILITAIS